jgi:hypothetical protein
LENHLLSKSTFQRGIQCEKSLYLYKNFIHLRDPISAEQKAVFNRGNKVGLLAQQLFPGGIDVSKLENKKENNRYSQMVEKTKELISRGVNIIYEAAFQHEQVLIILDILVKKDNKWYAYEVKSSTRITQTYLTDISLQYWVISKTGLKLNDTNLVIINNKYKRKEKLDLNELFTIRSVQKEVINNIDTIEQHVYRLKNTAVSAQIPNTTIGEHCFVPYNCDFKNTCWKNIPKNSVFEISGVPKSALFELYNAGYRTIESIPPKNNLNKNTNIHIQAIKSRKKIINKLAIQEFISKIKYPVSFLDFEVFMPAIPIFKNTSPYEHIPFQYSLHVKNNKDSITEHRDFLSEQGIDPRKTFLESLLTQLPKTGTVLVYDTLMEIKILNSLKDLFPEYTNVVNNIISRIVDLMKPFSEKNYYQAEMHNSFSIKNVVQALAPSLNHNDLSIPNGSIAMTSFENLQTETDMLKILETRDNLLEYCKMDTLAMVKIFEELEKLA